MNDPRDTAREVHPFQTFDTIEEAMIDSGVVDFGPNVERVSEEERQEMYAAAVEAERLAAEAAARADAADVFPEVESEQPDVVVEGLEDLNEPASSDVDEPKPPRLAAVGTTRDGPGNDLPPAI